MPDILIVDDTPVNLKLLSELLAKYGYKTRTAMNGQDALEAINTQPPDLILLDIMIPKMSGYEVGERLQANPETKSIPIIFISALSDTDNIVRAFEVGGVDYIVKPFKFREVLARVKNHLTLIEQHHQIEESKERERQYYETLSQMKDHFISAATHDLKNPLSLIIGYASLLETVPTVVADEDAMLFVKGIQQGTYKMTNLVTEMLELLQLESGIQLDIALVSLHDFMTKVTGKFEHTARQKPVTLTVKLPEEDVMVAIDEARIERVLDNLISNAIKYTQAGGEVNIQAQVKADHWSFHVEDNGYGIPADDLPRLFEAFFRVKEKQHREIEGTGLGLAIVNSIVEQHHGEIYIKSELGTGSRFSVLLPLSVEEIR